MAQAPSQNVPVTVLSSYVNQFPATALVIGQNQVPFNGSSTTGSYWYVAIELTTLSVQQNIITTDAANVPAAIQALVGNPKYFLFFVSSWQSTMNMINGPLYTFLQQVGSNGQLDRGEQMIDQLGTGWLHSFSYILATTFDNQDTPGFEIFSDSGYAVLTMQFMPVTVNGQTQYVPVQPF
jgi:hypothetical protein